VSRVDDAVRRLTPLVASVLAPNPGPMTLSGTNTWVLGDPGAGPVVVVDPGPEDDGHLARVLDVAGGRVSTVLLTHRHLDHSAGAAAFARRAGCAVRAVDPDWRVAPDGGPEAEDAGLADGTVVTAPGVRLEVLATPGHTSDSVSLLATYDGPGARPDLLTGDTVLGFGSTVITHPDGDLGAYLHALDRLLVVVGERKVARILPGHGPVVDDPAAVLAGYRKHRLERLAQVRDALSAGARTPEEVLAAVYPDAVGTPVERAAAESVRAQLDHLAAHREP
jgi:glyoxylase-like metal-dependent hydrolase (beta-lactamase superfamily II)